MIKVRAWKWRILIFIVVFTTLYCIKLWRPERQIELHQKNLLHALEDRRWGQVESQFSKEYRDRFGHTRATAMNDLQDGLRQFFALTIKSQGSQIVISGDTATVTVNLTMTGTGTGATEWIMTEVNRLPTPWVFSWRKTNVFPWSWELVQVDNPSLTIPDRSVF